VFDSAAGAAHKLGDAAMVITMNSFKANMEFSDVLLPTAPFTETSGTFVNAEGRIQSFYAVTRPLGETRPGWKILRVLGNLLHLPGFDFESSADVLAQVPDAQSGTGFVAMNRLSNKTAAPLKAEVSNAPPPMVASIYQLDGLVRRAPALQATADGRAGGIDGRSNSADEIAPAGQGACA
jgi:NADH-quinone oxidoreductase subunit G